MTISLAKQDAYKSGAEELVLALFELDVKVIFCITGAGNLAVVDALVRDGRIEIVYCHHEQSCVMAAQGYSRVTGKIGVALVTTGGGTTNAATGMLSSNLDSVPILLVSGNENSLHLNSMQEFRAVGVQGFDSTRLMAPICKSTYRIKSQEEVFDAVKQITQIAMKDRKGSVHLDFPMDLQRKTFKVRKVSEISIFSENEEVGISHSQKNEISSLIFDLERSHRPIVYFGNGCRYLTDRNLLGSFLKKFQIPFFTSWSAIDLFENSHKLNMGRIGIYGDRAANLILQKCDLFISFGSRLAIPQTGYDITDFARKAKKWVVEIDPVEQQKFPKDWNVLNCDVEEALKKTYSSGLSDIQTVAWHLECKNLWKTFPRSSQVGTRNTKYIHSFDVIEKLSKVLAEDAIVVTDVGAGLLSGHYGFSNRKGQRLFTSQGLGEMGFGLPAAIGAFFAQKKKRQLVCLNTDGAIMFNLQELQLINHYSIPLKLFIFNNAGYAMISISQKNLFNEKTAGSRVGKDISFPNFQELADTFKLSYVPIRSSKDLEEVVPLLADATAYLFDVIIDPDQRYLPRLNTTKTPDGALVSPPLEDLDPLIDLKLLESSLGYKASSQSYRIRGLDETDHN